jgi:polyhydroxyalkanoate synthesis regulator phasin
MEEKIELNMFLNKLVSAVVRKFEKLERDMEMIKSDTEKFKQTGDMKEVEEKIRNLEFSVNSLRSKSQVDKSILKLIETEEQERKM